MRFQPTGLSNVLIGIKGWKFDEDGTIIQIDSTNNGGQTGRIGGRNDANGTVDYSFDLDAPTYSTQIAIRKNVTGLILCFVSPVTPIQYPIIITKVHWETQTDTEVKGSFDWAMNIFAGAIIYPVSTAVPTAVTRVAN